MSGSDDDRTVAVRLPKISSKDDLVTRATLSRPAGRLTVIAGPMTGTVFELSHSSCLIGRDPAQNHIVLEADQTVHRKPHAALEYKAGTFILHDMQHNSRVVANGRQIEGPTALKFGDEIALGATVMKLTQG